MTGRISDQLHRILPNPCLDRPFVCDGLPEDCVLVIIGENPALDLQTDWWIFWNDISGFDLKKFELVFEAKRKAENKQLQAFRRLKRLRNMGLKCLETNVYRNENLGGHKGGNRLVSNCDVLQIFLNEPPRLKGIIAHGNKAHAFISSQPPLPPHIKYYPTLPLKSVSYDKIDAIAREIIDS